MRNLLVLFVAFAAVAFAGTADAQKRRGKSACGVDYMPLQEGITWTYQPANPAPGATPTTLTIKVAKVDGDEVVFEETYRDQTFTVQASCAGGGLIVSPSSFLFAAEPGGGVLATLENVEHKGSSFPGGKRLASGAQWFEELGADVIRQAAEGTGAEHPKARVEMERLVTVRGIEPVDTGFGRQRAMRIGFEIRGRGVIGETSQEIPVREEGALWVSDRLGVVRARDITGKEWELIGSSLLDQ